MSLILLAEGHQNIYAEEEEIVAGCATLIILPRDLTLAKCLFQSGILVTHA